MLDGAKNVATIGIDLTWFQGKQLTADCNHHTFNSLTSCQDGKIDEMKANIDTKQGKQLYTRRLGI